MIKKYTEWGQVNDMLLAMPNGNGVKFDKEPPPLYDIKVSKITVADIFILGKTPNLFHVVSMATRPGAEYFFDYWEHTYFEPDTPANNEYEFRIFKWHEFLWSIASIPAEKSETAYVSAKEAKMKLADGIPWMVGNPVRIVASSRKATLEAFPEIMGVAQWFPLNGNNVFTLENTDGPLYEGPGGARDLYIESDFKIKQLLESKGLSWEDYLKRRKSCQK